MGFEVDIQDASGLDAPRAIKRALTGNYDVIAGNVRMGLYLGYPLARILRTPFVGSVSDPLSDIDDLPSPLFRLLAWYEWQILAHAEGCSFTYESSYREALDRGIDTARRLPNAVDYELFANPSEASIADARDVLEAEGVDPDAPIAIYIGLLAEHYHITDILEAAAETPEWQFLFVGEGDLENEVESAARTHENVYYPGAFAYELMPGFLHFADAGFCFKDAEQPLKLKEYGAAGLPTIVQPGTLQSFYSEKELVFVEPTGTTIAETLENLSPETRDRYGETLQARVEQSSWEEIAEGFGELFDDTLEGLE
jgi:glycosyltransferase involved in cell wall biosynthesis